MTKTMEVKTEAGIFELGKPNAGKRNRALIKAESSGGNYKISVLMMELLPSMIIRRPENMDKDVPIEHILDGLEVEDYDLLVEGATKLLFNIDEKKTTTKPSIISSTVDLSQTEPLKSQ